MTAMDKRQLFATGTKKAIRCARSSPPPPGCPLEVEDGTKYGYLRAADELQRIFVHLGRSGRKEYPTAATTDLLLFKNCHSNI